MMETLKGYVERVIYRSDESGYTVLVLSSKEDEQVCTGVLPVLSEGEMLEVSGVYTVHSSYGRQMRVSRYRILPPEDEVAVERYLGSGAVKGIGKALAARIVAKFHEETFHIMENEPDRLAEVKGISEKKAREIAAQMEEKRDMRQAYLFLSGYGISNALAAKIYQKYGMAMYGIIRTNPYQMAEDIRGVGFRIADQIAQKAGIAVDSGFRIRSGILYVLSMAVGEGHMYLPADVLKRRVEETLEISPDPFDEYLRDLSVDRKAVIRGNNVYIPSLYREELSSARMFCDLQVRFQVDEDKVLRRIRTIERAQGITLDEQQRGAVLEAVRSGVLVLTGGPGTGKTTTIRTMLDYFEEEGMRIALAAPTGRAAKRMTEATGREAMTIHRLLEVEGGPEEDGPATFGRDASHPLEADVLIIDEMSMVDINLMYALLSALVPGTRLILSGDADQLPSVGPGSVLNDIISSGTARVVRLSHIFRQAMESDIVVNAHRIIGGEHFTPKANGESRDFFFVNRSDPARIIQDIVRLLTRGKLSRHVNAAWQELQILVPSRKGLLGVELLNQELQKLLNPSSPGKSEVQRGELLLRRGDKVMHIRNNYQLEWEVRGRHGAVLGKGTGVFNGDIGRVTEIDPHMETVTVCYEENRFVEYPFAGLDELELAYALTIHKSQGSEYPAVIMPLLPGPRKLMNRNLLYTAVTRARSCVIILGELDVMMGMIDNANEMRRYTGLRERLQEMEAMKQ